MKIKVPNNSAQLGVEISDLNLSEDFSGDQIAEIRKLGEEGKAVRFAQLYGNSFIKDFLERNPTYRKEDFPSVFVRGFDIVPLVPSIEVAAMLVKQGVLRVGSTVRLPYDFTTPTGELIKAGDPINLIGSK